eukprot:TRINITY_DN4655_c0_g3_i1.p1 TRINITY_DN4655_c0_g3~~TRINITY_DN4655_c0_g3_i1.p1  ORF type:complete len:1531 (+),score=276.09 TRINITY_DN4655_c0_g3_i1:246-4838(+)
MMSRQVLSAEPLTTTETETTTTTTTTTPNTELPNEPEKGGTVSRKRSLKKQPERRQGGLAASMSPPTPTRFYPNLTRGRSGPDLTVPGSGPNVIQRDSEVVVQSEASHTSASTTGAGRGSGSAMMSTGGSTTSPRGESPRNRLPTVSSVAAGTYGTAIGAMTEIRPVGVGASLLQEARRNQQAGRSTRNDSTDTFSRATGNALAKKEQERRERRFGTKAKARPGVAVPSFVVRLVEQVLIPSVSELEAPYFVEPLPVESVLNLNDQITRKQGSSNRKAPKSKDELQSIVSALVQIASLDTGDKTDTSPDSAMECIIRSCGGIDTVLRPVAVAIVISYIRYELEPLLSQDDFDDFLSALDMHYSKFQMNAMHSALHALPDSNLQFLKLMVRFLSALSLTTNNYQKPAELKMTLGRIVSVFGASLLLPQKDHRHHHHQLQLGLKTNERAVHKSGLILSYMLREYESLFVLFDKQFKYEYDSGGNFLVTASTLDNIVDKMLDVNYSVVENFADIVFQTLSYFTTPEELLDRLLKIHKDNLPNPAFIPWQHNIRFRILQLLLHWVANYGIELAKNASWMSRISRFIEQHGAVRFRNKSPLALEEQRAFGFLTYLNIAQKKLQPEEDEATFYNSTMCLPMPGGSEETLKDLIEMTDESEEPADPKPQEPSKDDTTQTDAAPVTAPAKRTPQFLSSATRGKSFRLKEMNVSHISAVLHLEEQERRNSLSDGTNSSLVPAKATPTLQKQDEASGASKTTDQRSKGTNAKSDLRPDGKPKGIPRPLMKQSTEMFWSIMNPAVSKQAEVLSPRTSVVVENEESSAQHSNDRTPEKTEEHNKDEGKQQERKQQEGKQRGEEKQQEEGKQQDEGTQHEEKQQNEGKQQEGKQQEEHSTASSDDAVDVTDNISSGSEINVGPEPSQVTGDKTSPSEDLSNALTELVDAENIESDASTSINPDQREPTTEPEPESDVLSPLEKTENDKEEKRERKRTLSKEKKSKKKSIRKAKKKTTKTEQPETPSEPKRKKKKKKSKQNDDQEQETETKTKKKKKLKKAKDDISTARRVKSKIKRKKTADSLTGKSQSVSTIQVDSSDAIRMRASLSSSAPMKNHPEVIERMFGSPQQQVPPFPDTTLSPRGSGILDTNDFYPIDSPGRKATTVLGRLAALKNEGDLYRNHAPYAVHDQSETAGSDIRKGSKGKAPAPSGSPRGVKQVAPETASWIGMKGAFLGEQVGILLTTNGLSRPDMQRNLSKLLNYELPAVTDQVSPLAPPSSSKLLSPARPPSTNHHGKADFLSLSPYDIALQLTLIDHELCKTIPPRELLHKRYMDHSKAPFFNTMADRFNLTANWVSSEVFRHETAQGRADVITHFIRVAQASLKMNNFNTLIAILAAFNNTAVSRLKLSWEKVRSFELKRYKSLMLIADTQGNFGYYRQLAKKIAPPMVPYLALISKDLFGLEEGNPTFLDQTEEGVPKVVNISKMRLLWKQVTKFSDYQIAYSLPSHQKLHILNMTTMTEKELYDESYRLEPRAQPSSTLSS